MVENSGTLTIRSSIISDSSKDGLLGGGSATVSDSLILRNDRGAVAFGGVTLINCTVDSNRLGVLAHVSFDDCAQLADHQQPAGRG